MATEYKLTNESIELDNVQVYGTACLPKNALTSDNVQVYGTACLPKNALENKNVNTGI